MDKKQQTPKDNQEEIPQGINEEQTQPVENADMVKMKKEIEIGEDKYKRALADYQNLQRRTQEEKMQWIRSANKDLLLKILTIFDTLTLAQKHIEDKGLTLAIQQFEKILTEEGAVRISTGGKEFDPSIMECVVTQQGEKGKVLEEVRAGFMLHGFVLRSAQVIVGEEK